MLSPKEKAECKRILSFLADEDVLALVGTSTSYAIKVSDRAEAEHAILTFTESADELLNRRKVNKGILMKYCLTASVPVSAYDSKADLVNAIVKYWARTPTEEPMAPASGHNLRANAPSMDSYQNHNQSASNRLQAVSHNQQVNIVQNFISLRSVNETYNQTVNLSGIPAAASSNQSDAEAFVKWFYEMLNSYHPAVNKSGEPFGPHHFWDNAHLYLLMVPSAENKEENILGGDKVAERLLSLTKFSHIIFNPNVSSQGVTLTSTNHGSKVILVCGTLHSVSACVGTFQQSFALVSDPLNPGKWKVKVTCLKMDQCTASTLPKLEDCQEIQAIEAHTRLALHQLAVSGY
ncbi:hypothetical protein BsWGS_04045 [Bradybaena similaris]